MEGDNERGDHQSVRSMRMRTARPPEQGGRSRLTQSRAALH